MNEAGIDIDIDLIDRAAILHDLAKMSGKQHGQNAAEIIRNKGWSEKLAQIVALHQSNSVVQAMNHSWEAMIINYADRRASKGGKLITIKEWRAKKSYPDREKLYQKYLELEENLKNVLQKINVNLEDLIK